MHHPLYYIFILFTLNGLAQSSGLQNITDFESKYTIQNEMARNQKSQTVISKQLIVYNSFTSEFLKNKSFELFDLNGKNCSPLLHYIKPSTIDLTWLKSGKYILVIYEGKHKIAFEILKD